MHFRILDTNIKVALSVPIFADELFLLTDRNRQYLKQWLPWLDTVRTAEDTKEFIENQLRKFSAGEALHQTIFFQDQIAGVIAFNQLDQTNDIGHIGYWLGQEFTGKGIMTTAVTDLIKMGFRELKLQKVEIRCAADNTKSRAIPERLGFQQEGRIRNAEKLYDNYCDHILYGLLRTEPIKISRSQITN